MNKCNTCLHFKRMNWRPDLGGEPTLGGKCDVLMHVLKDDNLTLWNVDLIYVQDTFGCVLHRPNNQGGKIAAPKEKL